MRAKVKNFYPSLGLHAGQGDHQAVRPMGCIRQRKGGLDPTMLQRIFLAYDHIVQWDFQKYPRPPRPQ